MASLLLLDSRTGAKEAAMSREQLHKKISYLESVNDHLMTELGYMNELLKRNGFPEGLESLKKVAREMLADGDDTFPKGKKAN
jgi:hypothetical protein